MQKKIVIVGVGIFVAAIVALAAFGTRVLWDIFQVLEHGL